jgi:hypothetical protein
MAHEGTVELNLPPHIIGVDSNFSGATLCTKDGCHWSAESFIKAQMKGKVDQSKDFPGKDKFHRQALVGDMTLSMLVDMWISAQVRSNATRASICTSDFI